MKYENMNNTLLQRFPNLAGAISDEMSFYEWEQPGQHVLYEHVLNPYVGKLLERNMNRIAIEYVFDFYEEMALSKDVEVNNLLQVTLLEYLWDNPVVYYNALQYMLPETRRINDCIAEYTRIPKK